MSEIDWFQSFQCLADQCQEAANQIVRDTLAAIGERLVVEPATKNVPAWRKVAVKRSSV